MIIVTGGAGFIGSNLVKQLNAHGIDNILVVDDLSDGSQFKNLSDCRIYDYLDKADFLTRIQMRDEFEEKITAIFHQGACSDTTEWDGHYMMQNNYDYSKVLLHYCLDKAIPFIYASSAAVYGNSQVFTPSLENEGPLNVYGYSKFLFDQYVRRLLPKARSQIVGLRYFNVYGPREQHKGRMASVAYHFYQQIKTQGVVKLFAGANGYADGEQQRDFVYVEDVVDVNLWFLDNPKHSGIYNCGTGRSQSFNDVARAVITGVGHGDIEYIPFPEDLKGHYQSFTQADIASLRAVGYRQAFKTVEAGVQAYLAQLAE